MIVSSGSYNLNRRDIIIIMIITGQVCLPLNSGEALLADRRKAGLVKESVLKPVFTTLEQGMVLQTLGALQPNDQLQLQHILASVIG